MVESNNLDSRIAKVMTLFRADDPINSYEEYTKLVQLHEKSPDSRIQTLIDCKEMKLLKEDMAILHDFQKNFMGDQKLPSDWTRYIETPDLRIYHKNEPSLANLTLYLEKIIECPLINLVSILCEADHYKEWLPLIVKSRLLGRTSHFRQIGEFEGWLPWPLSNRTALLQVCGMYLPHDNSNFLTIRSIDSDNWQGIPITRDPKAVYVGVHNSSFYVKQLGGNKILLKVILNGDPKINFLPQKLIDWGMKKAVYPFIKILEKRSREPPEMYAELMEQKKDFYDSVKKILSRDPVELEHTEGFQTDNQILDEKAKL